MLAHSRSYFNRTWYHLGALCRKQAIPRGVGAFQSASSSERSSVGRPSVTSTDGNQSGGSMRWHALEERTQFYLVATALVVVPGTLAVLAGIYFRFQPQVDSLLASIASR